jgi:nitrogen fixation NifU-like protein
MNEYARELILDYYRNPRHKGHLEPHTHSHEERNPTCGDIVRMDLLVEDGVVRDASFDGQGCSVSQASASMVAESIIGKSLDEVRAMNKDDILEMLGGIELNPSRLRCATLGLVALHKSLIE